MQRIIAGGNTMNRVTVKNLTKNQARRIIRRRFMDSNVYEVNVELMREVIWHCG